MTTQADPTTQGGHGKDIVIIGGGAVGALSAFELQRAGHRVTLLEAVNWGNGSSRRSAACIRAQFGTESTVQAMIYCIEYYKNWKLEVRGDRSPLVQSGYLYLKDWKTDMDRLERTVELQRRAGLSDVELIVDRMEIHNRFPFLETSGILAATWCPRDGFLAPELVYGDAVNAAEAHGAQVIQNAEVVEVVLEGDRAIAVKTRRGETFSGDLFVNACGVWAPRISCLFDGFPLNIKARRRYLYIVGGLTDVETYRTLPMTITPRGAYCRPEGVSGELLMLGWMHETSPVRPRFDDQDTFEPGFGFETSDTNGYGFAVLKEIGTYIEDVRVNAGPLKPPLRAAQAGFYEDTPDHNPLIGFDPWTPNLIHAAGFSGHGLMQAPFTAAAVTQIVNAGRDIEEVALPGGLKVNMRPYTVDRVFAGGEDMVI